MAIYLKTPFAKGEVAEPSHKEWIKLDSMSFSSGRTVRTPTGRVADRQADIGHISEVHVTKDLDTASPDLFMGTCVGPGEKLEIHVTRTGSKKDATEIVYLTYELENSLLTSFSVNTSGSKPSETVTINFTKMKMTYTPQDAAATGKGQIPVTFNQAEGKGEGA
jgi:type VI secretion system secreted protein Hcp